MVNLIRGPISEQPQNIKELLNHYYTTDEQNISRSSQRLSTLFNKVVSWTIVPFIESLSQSDTISDNQYESLREKAISDIEAAASCGQIEIIRRNTLPWILSKREFRALTWVMVERTSTSHLSHYLSDWPNFWRALSKCKRERQAEMVALLPINFLYEESQSTRVSCENLRNLVQERISDHQYKEFLATCDAIFSNIIENREVTLSDDTIENGILKGLALLQSKSPTRLSVFLNLCMISRCYMDYASERQTYQHFPNHLKYFDWNKINDDLTDACRNGILDDFTPILSQENSILFKGCQKRIIAAQELLRHMDLVTDLSIILTLSLKLAEDGSQNALLDKILRLLQICPFIQMALLNVIDSFYLNEIKNLVNTLLELLENTSNDEEQYTTHEMFRLRPNFYFEVVQQLLRHDLKEENALNVTWKPFLNHFRNHKKDYAAFHFPKEPYDFDLDCFEYLCDLIYIAPQFGEQLLDLTLNVRDNELFYIRMTMFIRNLIYTMKDPESCFQIAYYLYNAKWHTEHLDESDSLFDDIITLGFYSEDDQFHPMNVWWKHKENERTNLDIEEPSTALCSTSASLSLNNIRALSDSFLISKDRIPADVNLTVWGDLLLHFECEVNEWNPDEIQIIVKERMDNVDHAEPLVSDDESEEIEFVRDTPLMRAYFGTVKQFGTEWADAFGDPLIEDWIDAENYPPTVPFYKAQFAAIVHWILTLSTVAPAEHVLSPRNEAIYKLMQSILWCSEAKRNGIALFYAELPDDFKYKGDGLDLGDEEIIRSKQSIALLVQGFLEKTINADSFLRALTGITSSNKVVSQEVHQITYALNVLSPYLGLTYGTMFDMHTQMVYRKLMQRQPKEILTIFLNFARPHNLIAHVIAATKQNFQLSRSFIDLIPPSYVYWHFNEDQTQITLKKEGALRLLQIEGYLVTSEPSRIDHWVPQLFLDDSSAKQTHDFFDCFSWDPKESPARQIQRKRTAIDRVLQAETEAKNRMQMYICCLNQSTHYKQQITDRIVPHQKRSFETEWNALLIEPYLSKFFSEFDELAARAIAMNPHPFSLVTFFEQKDILIQSIKERVADPTLQRRIKQTLESIIETIITRELHVNLERIDLIPFLTQWNLLMEISEPNHPQFDSIKNTIDSPSFKRRRWEQFKSELYGYHQHIKTKKFDLSKFTELCKRALILLPEGDQWIASGFEDFIKLYEQVITTIESKAPLLHIFDLTESKAVYNKLMKRLKLPGMKLDMQK